MNRDLQTALAALVCAAACLSWGNGPPGNAQVNELADVLHTFFLNVVQEEE